MSETSPRLQLPLLQPAQAQKHVTHNEALQLLDAVVQLRVLTFGASVPPGNPISGDVHAVGTAATDAWEGADGQLALWDGTGWLFVPPREGWRAWDGQDLRVHEAGVWRSVLQGVMGLGVNAPFDAQNRLAVAAPATLLSHEGAGHQLKVNKATAADTASLLFQQAFEGQAEMGLAGDNDFALKVSGGGEWRDALKVARDTGRVRLPQGATVDGPLTGTAVQTGPTDATPGRLLTAGAFGLGGLLPDVGNASVTDNSLAPGLYSYDTANGSSGGPAAVSRGSLLHTRRAANGGETQTLVVEIASGAGAYAGLTFSRSRGSGTWTAWYCGTLVLSGSNANGRFVRHQDGTQTCWHTLTTSDAAETTWTFPSAFATTTGLVVTMGVAGGAVALLAPRHTAKTATGVGLSVINATPARVAAPLDVCATGRWY